MDKIYLDHAATTPVGTEVINAMLPFMSQVYGNTSSLHSFGQEAKTAVERTRDQIAAHINARPEEIVFTGGGTESNNWAIKGVALARKDKGNHIITSTIEHHAVLEVCGFMERQGLDITYLPVDEFGFVDPGDVKKAITDRTILISVMHANNEIGTIEPIAEIGAIAKNHGVYFHTDAVQTFGHCPIDVEKLNVDLLSACAHKLCGPKGAGLLYIRKGTRIEPFLHGGDQERRLRASTLNVPGIIGMGKAAEIALAEIGSESLRLTALRDRLIEGLLSSIEDSRLNGHPARRLAGNANISIAYIEGEAMLLSLDMQGIAASTGSACTSASMEPSHVLSAIGLPHELAHGSLRFSMGRSTTHQEIERVIDVLPSIVNKLRSVSPQYRRRA
ncbi:MAG TPA: cysteine desulfurase NifS [Deltaproteobacteria bacterium]|nr:cysteine desulfurase NifS [Deltaproteobacteria bacterium]